MLMTCASLSHVLMQVLGKNRSLVKSEPASMQNSGALSVSSIPESIRLSFHACLGTLAETMKKSTASASRENRVSQAVIALVIAVDEMHSGNPDFALSLLQEYHEGASLGFRLGIKELEYYHAV